MKIILIILCTVTVYSIFRIGKSEDIENGIYLRSRDFVKCDFLPLAYYWSNITLQTIPVGTYIDPIRTVTT